jgi:hypothetical protein
LGWSGNRRFSSKAAISRRGCGPGAPTGPHGRRLRLHNKGVKQFNHPVVGELELAVPAGADGAEACRAVIEQNELEGVTWLHSYVSEDKTKTFCVYDAPSPEAIRKSAADNGLQVDAMTEVRVLDPYLYF